MVRMHRFVPRPELAWVSGVLFERDDTQLLVTTTAKGSEITLRARGPERKALLSVIASDLDALNASFAGLGEKVHKRVPCVCSECALSASPEMFDERKLLKRRSDNRMTVECDASYEDVNVLELLDGLDLEQLPKWAEVPESRTIKIFLASSEELREDRDEFDLYLRQQNDLLRKRGIYLEIVRWETFLDAMSENRLQDEYNREVRASDIFVSLFFTKAGRFTEEEFDAALKAFGQEGKPRIYTYFKNAEISIGDVNKQGLTSLWDFQEKLKKLGHFPTLYKNTEGLRLHFRDQLEKLLDENPVQPAV
jgi:hypothetical protein